MKKEHITPKVIELASEITKHWPMEIYEGCWAKYNEDVCLVTDIIPDIYAEPSAYRVFLSNDGEESEIWVRVGSQEIIPIPSIIDCVDKIKELKLKLCYRLQDDIRGWHEFSIWDDPEDGPITSARCSNLLEAALSALLGLLKREEEKKNFVR